MIFHDTDLPGCHIIELDAHEDDRGFFARAFAAEEFEARGLNPCVAECSISFNSSLGTLRGLHYQAPPHAEAKLVRCTRGRVFDVAVDLRRKRWTAVELSAQNRLSLYIPEGFAHGFLTLEPESELLYLISTAYVPASSEGVRWDDAMLGILWPRVPTLTISERDRSLPTLAAPSP